MATMVCLDVENSIVLTIVSELPVPKQSLQPITTELPVWPTMIRVIGETMANRDQGGYVRLISQIDADTILL